MVLELNAGPENVGGSPSLGESKTVLGVGVLALEVTGDGGVLVVASSGDLEGDVGRSAGLDLKGGAKDGEVLGEKVVGGLAKVLWESRSKLWMKLQFGPTTSAI